ncbi:MAG: 50S ribosomal protein L10 [Thermoplasmatota archaeon]
MPAQWKIEEVEQLKDLVDSYPVVGIVDIHGIPASQMHEMRRELRGDAVVRVSKNTLIRLALADKNGQKALAEHVEGQSAVIATDMNPFKLYKRLEAAKMDAPAKGGETAPDDIVVKKGKTPFKPGPIVGDLQQVGIPAAIREGAIVIEKTVTVVEKGETIEPRIAKMLAKLEIYPMEVGLDARAIYEDGSLFTPDVLSIDEQEVIDNFKTAAGRALSLARGIAYPAAPVLPQLLQKAYRDSLALALETETYTSDTVTQFIGRAHAQAASLAKELKTEPE